ncbi:hypothetical protein M407DRAFT_124323 [Tulasnella calospora MUT 4182]|uniref:Uncharacterized protein n=1 Tax=Tulasnella calospora MUT 4182 TaxID=1051891 RepID=A0A0C3QIA8_9AGAM|nr:hypothetical protein M407DRAFT_124323 [Tulasnella calospora MUT 4182]
MAPHLLKHSPECAISTTPTTACLGGLLLDVIADYIQATHSLSRFPRRSLWGIAVVLHFLWGHQNKSFNTLVVWRCRGG